MAHTRTDPEWSCIGWAAWDEEKFREAQREAITDDGIKLCLDAFFESPLTAILELRKARVRSLGGTISNSHQAVRRRLKAIPASGLQDALASHNFVVFKVEAKFNIPEAVSAGKLTVKADKSYGVTESLSPFDPSIGIDVWKIEMWRLARILLRYSLFCGQYVDSAARLPQLDPSMTSLTLGNALFWNSSLQG